MARDELSEQQIKFCEFYIELNHITKAAQKAGYAKDSAHVAGSKLLKIPKIRDYVQHLRDERQAAVRDELIHYTESAVKELYKLAMNADSETVRLQALKDILDRGGLKPVEKTENKNEIQGKIEFGFVDPVNET